MVEAMAINCRELNIWMPKEVQVQKKIIFCWVLALQTRVFYSIYGDENF